jgi:hypothetical protein
MNKHHCIFTSIAVTLAITCLSAPVNASPITYTYTGNPFDSITIDSGNSPPWQNYYFSHVSIQFTIDSSLVPKNGHFEMPFSDPSVATLPISNFLISDGQFSISSNPLISKAWIGLSFDTDVNGNVAGRWDISAIADYSFFHLAGARISSTFNNSPALNSDYSYSYDYFTITDANIDNNPGIWTSSIVAVPLPGGLVLFGTALIGLCFTGYFSGWRIYNQETVAI